MAELDDLMHDLHERESRKAFGAWFQERCGWSNWTRLPTQIEREAWEAGERYGRRGNSSLREKSIRIV